MAQIHLDHLREIVLWCYLKDPVANGDAESYACGFADGIKFMIQRLTEMGIEVPDAELFE